MTWLTNGNGESKQPAFRPGSGPSSDPGPGCGATERPPTHDVDVGILSPFRHHPLYWLGPQFANLLLSYLVGTDPLYGDCASYRASDCPHRIQIQNDSICRVQPFTSTLPSRRFAYRGAIVAGYPSAEGWNVYTGATTVTVFGVGDRPRDIQPVIRALRRMPGASNRPAHRLPAPAFPDGFWRTLRSFERTYRRLGSEAAAGKALGVTPRDVHDKLTLARLLRRHGVKRHARC
jgi:hypothetical protein